LVELINLMKGIGFEVITGTRVRTDWWESLMWKGEGEVLRKIGLEGLTVRREANPIANKGYGAESLMGAR
jgi:hypothetical protein